MKHGPMDGSAAQQRDENALTALLVSYDSAATVDLALTAIDRQTGATYRYNGRAEFETASIVKVGILAILQLQAQRSARPLSASEQALAEEMIKNSDNDAASKLWLTIGAEHGFLAAATTLGLTATTPGDAGFWGTTRTNADDQARMLQTICDPGGPLDHARAGYVLGLMRTVRADQAWGISAAASDGEQIMLKNGWFSWSSLNDGWTVNSIGRITGEATDMILAVLSHGHETMSDGVNLVEDLARAARKHLAW